MSAGGADYAEFVMDQLGALRGVVSKRFFGGFALYADGVQFALIMGSSLYFLVDDVTRPAYERMGSTCFSFMKQDRRVDVRKYFVVPVELIEDQDQLVALAKESIRTATAAKRSAKKRARK
jgi:DNA transformation protein